MRLLLTALLFLFFGAHPAAAAGPVLIDRFIVCSDVSAQAPPTFTDAACSRKSLSDIDPQGHDLWIRGAVQVDKLLPDGQPLGLFVSGKASSEAYVNGVRLGANGTPAKSRGDEIPGRMDTVFYIPPAVLHAGENVVVLRLSAFHGAIRLTSPIQWIAVWRYSNPLDLLLRAYWPSLVTFGVLLAGGLFFASSAISRVNRRNSLLLSFLSLLAAGQLFTEVYRALTSYSFDFHDWRIIAVWAFSAAFGLVLAALIISRYCEKWRFGTFVVVSLLILSPLGWAAGFDGKAMYSLLLAAAVCAFIAGQRAIKGDRFAISSCAALVAMATSGVIWPQIFLNTLFYFEVAATLLVLFVMRALNYEKDRLEYEHERLRAHDLQLALLRAHPPEKAMLRVNAAGSVDIVCAADIAFCKGADDYVELHLLDRRVIFHNGSLIDLAKDLPPDFLRVHRSFIVNTKYIKKLSREGSGLGRLILTDGRDVPVSRRILPSVRSVLS